MARGSDRSKAESVLRARALVVRFGADERVSHVDATIPSARRKSGQYITRLSHTTRALSAAESGKHASRLTNGFRESKPRVRQSDGRSLPCNPRRRGERDYWRKTPQALATRRRLGLARYLLWGRVDAQAS
jgi:hypothetical protein